ncbi:MAG: IS66 family transposase, partial [Verrucomicrobiota bacterium]|nr:IS66 family transposase [Verrucomicrobiota bacterium]
MKGNSLEENQAKKGGAKPGHKGHGRKSLSAEDAGRVVRVELPRTCPDRGTVLRHRGTAKRTVLDGE